MIHCVAKTKKAFKLHSFDSLDDFYCWLQCAVIAFDKVEISMLDDDSGVKVI